MSNSTKRPAEESRESAKKPNTHTEKPSEQVVVDFKHRDKNGLGDTFDQYFKVWIRFNPDIYSEGVVLRAKDLFGDRLCKRALCLEEISNKKVEDSDEIVLRWNLTRDEEQCLKDYGGSETVTHCPACQFGGLGDDDITTKRFPEYHARDDQDDDSGESDDESDESECPQSLWDAWTYGDDCNSVHDYCWSPEIEGVIAKIPRDFKRALAESVKSAQRSVE